MRTDLKGLAEWDSHRECWVPENGKQDEVAAKLGPTWTFDEYYHAFFGQDPPKPEPVSSYPDYCGCYMCQGGSSCGGTMCCVETQPALSIKDYVDLRLSARLKADEGLSADSLEKALLEWQKETAGQQVSIRPTVWMTNCAGQLVPVEPKADPERG